MSGKPLKPAAITPLHTALVKGYCTDNETQQYHEGLLSESDITKAVRDKFSQFFQSHDLHVFSRIEAAHTPVNEVPLDKMAFTAGQYGTWVKLREAAKLLLLSLPPLEGFSYQTTVELRKKIVCPEGRPEPLEYPLALFTLSVTGAHEGLQLTRRFQL